MKFKLLSLSAVALFGWLSAHALEPDQVRGQVVDVNPEANAVTLRVMAAGENRSEQAGDVETYEFADDVAIQREPVGREILHSMAVGEVGVADLFAGDELVIGFEEGDDRVTARQVTVSEGPRPEEDGADIAPFETEEEEDQ
jgi:hypothetical protein